MSADHDTTAALALRDDHLRRSAEWSRAARESLAEGNRNYAERAVRVSQQHWRMAKLFQREGQAR